MRRRIVLLTTGSHPARLLAERLVSIEADLVLIVCEQAPRDFRYSPLSEFARRMLGDRLVNVAGRMKLSALAKRTIRAEQLWRNAANKHLLDMLSVPDRLPEWPSGVAVHTTKEINDERTLARVRALEPDLLVVYGTKILREPLISTAPMGALNAHSSLLPGYRGMRSEFWQCYHNDRASVGITIHSIDAGVDTGDILFSKPTVTSWPIDPFMLRARNVLSMLEHYPQVVQEHLDGLTRPRPQPLDDRPAYRGSDITMEKRIELLDRLTDL